MLERMRRYAAGQDGSVAVEYGLLLSLISVTMLVSLQTLGVSVFQLLDGIAAAIARAAAALNYPRYGKWRARIAV